jgi:probable F420-dependent oxidoreductase
MRIARGLSTDDWFGCGPAAREAEEDGFDCVTTAELRHDPFVPLAFAALHTRTVQLATSVAIAFPRSPMIVANTAFDLHRHSNGRFVLGLGTQVKAHNERRFSVPWSPPAPRIGEYVEALRAIWRVWEMGGKLAYAGEHYRFSLMTPEFAPPPTGLPLIPVTIAAVGQVMVKTAARHCDGVRLHGFATRRYLEEVVYPMLSAELQRLGKPRAAFEVSGGGFVATGRDEAAVAAAAEKLRYRVAFYASTPAYRPVLTLHGLEDLGDKLHAMTRRGEWERMAQEVADDVLDLFIVRATYAELAGAIERRFGGLVDTVSFEFSTDDGREVRREVIAAVHAIPQSFKGFDTSRPAEAA